MDSLITAAARALAAGDPLGALNRVALRDDAPALALRGIAMAQLGDLVRAKALLRKAARAFGPTEAVARVPHDSDITFAGRARRTDDDVAKNGNVVRLAGVDAAGAGEKADGIHATGGRPDETFAGQVRVVDADNHRAIGGDAVGAAEVFAAR